MKSFFNSSIGRLRLMAFFEGITLIILVFISIPLKHFYGITEISTLIGPIHGVLFLLFVVSTISVGVEYDWKFKQTTWKVLIACIIPFGTFYIDRTILKPQHKELGL